MQWIHTTAAYHWPQATNEGLGNHEDPHITAQKPDSTGSGVYLAQTARCMAQAGHEVAVICGIASGDIPALAGGIRVWPVRFDTPDLPFHVVGMSDTMPYPSTRYRDLTPQMVGQFEQAFGTVIDEAVRSFAPDVVVCHHLYLLAAIVRERLPHLPVAAVCHSTDLRQMAQHSLERRRILAAMRRLDAALALHGEQAREIEATYGIEARRVHVIGTGFDAHTFNRAGAPAHGGATGPLRLIYAGKIWERKGVMSLLEAIDRLEPSWPDGTPRGLELRLAGGHGGDEEGYARIVQRAGRCRHRVEFLGRLPQAQLAQEYRAADAFVLPSFFEGLPLVAIEALACGCRVVMTNLPGIRDWVDENAPGNGITWVRPPRMAGVDVPLAEDLPAFERRLANAIEQALNRPRHARDVSALTWEHVTERMVAAVASAC